MNTHSYFADELSPCAGEALVWFPSVIEAELFEKSPPLSKMLMTLSFGFILMKF